MMVLFVCRILFLLPSPSSLVLCIMLLLVVEVTSMLSLMMITFTESPPCLVCVRVRVYFSNSPECSKAVVSL